VTNLNEDSITAKAPRTSSTPLREDSITAKAPRTSSTPLREDSVTAPAPRPLREAALRTPVSGMADVARTPLPRSAGREREDSQTEEDDDDKPRESGGPA
jgi:hypothetical protein